MGEVVGLVAVLCIFGIPIVKICTEHQRKLLEMKMQVRNHGDGNLRAELDALRQEVRGLRDTCTQYDISFDTVLQRMEQRVQTLERRSQSVPDEHLHVGNGR